MADGSAKAPNEIDRLVGGLIRAARKQQGMSQEMLGDAIGLTFQQVQKYEKGTNRVSVGRLAEIARILKQPISYFFNEEIIGDILDHDVQADFFSSEKIGVKNFSRLMNAMAKVEDPDMMEAIIDVVERMARIKQTE